MHRDRLCCVVQYFGGLAWTSVINLYTGVSTAPVACQDSRGRGYGYSPGGGSMTDLGFPRVSCSPVEMCAVDSNFLWVSCCPVEMYAVDSNFPRSSFPPSELCTERQDCIRPGLWNDFMIDAAPVTGSLIYSAGPDGPSVTGGPVGQPGTLSPSTFASAILVDPGGTFPSSDLAGMLLPAIPVRPVGHMIWGTLSSSDSDPAGRDGSHVTGGPVGHLGTLTPTTSESGVLVDSGVMFPWSDLARMKGPAAPAGSPVLRGPVGPAMSLDTLLCQDCARSCCRGWLFRFRPCGIRCSPCRRWRS